MDDPPPPSGPAAQGRRQPFAERAGGIRGLATLALYNLIIAGSAAYFATLEADPGALAVFGVGAVALVTLMLLATRLYDLLAGRAIVSPCPVCGQSRTRTFGDLPAPCGACPAYLVAEGLQVREVAADAVECVPWFEVPQAALATRAGELKFPDRCAACGRDAPARRKVRAYDAAREAHRAERRNAIFPEGHSAAYSLATGSRPGAVPADGQVDARLLRLTYPACGRGDCDAEEHAVAACLDDLGFRSYGYYRDFCALNGIGGPP